MDTIVELYMSTYTHTHIYAQAYREDNELGIGNSRQGRRNSWLYFWYCEVGRVNSVSAASTVCQPSASEYSYVYKAAVTV